MKMTETEQKLAAFPGGIGVTHLRVYDSPAPDGLAGGSPHMHFACSEAYLTGNFLDQLHLGASDYLNQGRVWAIPVDSENEERKPGMCGTLRPYLPEGLIIARPT